MLPWGSLIALVTIGSWERARPATGWRRSGLGTVKLVSDAIGMGAGWLAAWAIADTLGWQGMPWQAASCLGILVGRAGVERLRADVRLPE